MTGGTENPGHTFSADMDLALERSAAFDTLVDELQAALRDAGIRFEAGPVGRITEGSIEVGRVVSWERGKRIVFRWTQASWKPEEVTEVEIRFEEAGAGTHVTLEHRQWGRLLGEESEVAGWFAGGVLAPLVKAMAPGWLGDWITDRRARRPSGMWARSFYQDPLYHYPGFRAILEELALSPEDRLLEVGCGGGVLLHRALASGCSGAGVDHSPAMVRLAREVNSEFLRTGKLEILEGSAERLPFPDRSFTCATMSGVFGFISDPVAALREISRVLHPGGRIVLLGSDPAMRGTPAAPEPMASRIYFYDDTELEGLARTAGFQEARVVRRSLETFARESGIPQEHLPLFGGRGTPLLVARKK
jgi:ubiquinone/menaquinone biosynthesis C-methylase UbiE